MLPEIVGVQVRFLIVTKSWKETILKTNPMCIGSADQYFHTQNSITSKEPKTGIIDTTKIHRNSTTMS